MAVQTVYGAVASIFRKCHLDPTSFALNMTVNCQNGNMTNHLTILLIKSVSTFDFDDTQYSDMQ